MCLLAVATASACSRSEPQAAEAPAPAGCYRIEAGAWQPAMPEQFASFYTLPDRMRLTTRAAEPPLQADGRHAVSWLPMPGLGGRVWPAAWRQPMRDSITVLMSDGLTGLELRFRLHSGGLQGVARALSDVVDSKVEAMRAPVRATRVPCTAEWGREPTRGG